MVKFSSYSARVHTPVGILYTVVEFYATCKQLINFLFLNK